MTVALLTLIAHLACDALGRVGPAVPVILQLVSRARIRPAETLPSMLQAIHSYLPMTYVVAAFPIAFTGGSGMKPATDLTILTVTSLVVFAFAVAPAARERTWSRLTVHPPVTELDAVRGDRGRQDTRPHPVKTW